MGIEMGVHFPFALSVGVVSTCWVIHIGLFVTRELIQLQCITYIYIVAILKKVQSATSIWH